VQLNIRGICSLRPGVPGVSEKIEVTSVVGRFLEHSRIYSFERGEETRIYIGSPDLMPRNLYNRVELLTPVEAPELQGQLSDVLDRSFADNTNAWELKPSGEWERRSPGSEPPRNLQKELLALHTERFESRPPVPAA
jgi:polyphosphate kinase